MPISALRRAILAKLETTYGTDAVPTAADDGVLVRSITPTETISLTGVDRTLIRPFYGSFQQLQGSAFMRIELELEVAGFGTAGPATPTAGYDALLRACGLARTIVATTSVDYEPVSTGFESVTIYFYNDGKLYKGTGCRGTLVMSLTVGQIPVYRMTLTGKFEPVTDTAIVAPVVTAYQTPLLVNATNSSGVEVQGYAAVLQSFEFDLGNQVETRELVGSPPQVLITGRSSTATIEIEDTLVAASNWEALVQAATIGTMEMVHGTAAGNIVSFLSERAQLTTPTQQDVQNIVHRRFNLRFVPSGAGNDEFLLRVA